MALFVPSAESKRASVFGVASIFLLSVWITLSLRLWVRIALIRSFGWDDAFLLFAALIFTGYCTVVFMIETVGGAQRINELDLDELSRLVGIVVASFDLYISAMILFKISLGIFYLRIVIRSWQRYAVYTAVILNTIYGTFMFFIALFNCGDPSRYLENEIAQVCLDKSAIYSIQLAGCIINAITDWTFAILPIFVLTKATMPLPAKISAGFILLLGCCGSIVSLVRIQYIEGLAPGPNFFNTALGLCIWSIVECGLGISAASAATLRPLFRGLLERTRFTVSNVGSASRPKRSPETSSNTRLSQHNSEDPPLMVELLDLESQSQRSARSARSHFSAWSIAPVIKNARVMSKLGVHRETIEERAHLSPSPPPRASVPVPPKLPPPVPPKPPKSSVREIVRQKSQRAKTKMSRSNSSRKRPRIVRQESVRDKGISRPLPHIVSQVASDTAAKATPSSQTDASLPLMSVDSRRRGSPDWTGTGSKTRSHRQPSGMRTFFDDTPSPRPF
ncbi:hypothetical protein HII31_04614 [Pseudocercospora fuligena]|uniref:Rhodopsin domain-containing protein n=1 Tax=Pseudocercospora fuligena TaxID=685502 RepID=A0A8H6RNK9_9PEZI|nr:hypothetical protein HII31_04614 [Pseudocercospora fuligena]